MDLVQFFQENNEYIENEHLKDMNNPNSFIVVSSIQNNTSSSNNKSTKIESSTFKPTTKNKLTINESLFNSNSFTDYSSIDCDSLTDSSNKWQQPNNEQQTKLKFVKNNFDDEIKEDLITENIDEMSTPRPRISHHKPLLAEILNDDEEENEYEKVTIKQPRPDRPRTRRGRGQELRANNNSNYVQLNDCVTTKRVENNTEIMEELGIVDSTTFPKEVEVINFEENDIIVEDESLYTPTLPIDDDDTITEETESNKNSIEYVTYAKIELSTSHRNSKINEVNKSLPKIINQQVKNMKLIKTERNYQNSPYSKLHEFQSGRTTTLSNFKDLKYNHREKFNVSRTTSKSNDSKSTMNSALSSLHLRKMNQDELLQSVNRLSNAPKRNLEHQKFQTLHDKFSNVDIDAVSLRLFNSKSHRSKNNLPNQKTGVKCLNKIEIDKMVRILFFFL
jgi:hypothetical protein